MNTIAQSALGASAYARKDYEFDLRPDDDERPFGGESGSQIHSWAQLIDDLLAIRGLNDDWDGQGAVAPHSALVDFAIALAKHFQASRKEPADRVIAGVNGTIYFEWHDGAGYLEIEVTTPQQAEGRMIRKGSGTTEVFTLSRRS